MRRAAGTIAATIVALAAIASIGWALTQFAAATRSLEITATQWGPIPVTVFSGRTDETGTAVPVAPADRIAHTTRPVVVIAHGFAGSQQLMQPFAVTLARNGYLAVTFDFPGHGRHPTPLPGSLREHDALLAALLASIEQTVTGAQALPQSDRRVAVLGHSMASDLVVRYAQAHPEIAATVGVSLVFGGAQMIAPRNLLSIYGSLEPAMVQAFGRTLVAGTPDGTPSATRAQGVESGVAYADVKAGVTYGSLADGSARRFALAAGAEHIGVLYHPTSLRETLDWLDGTFARVPLERSTATSVQQPRFIDARGRAIAALMIGVVALTWPLSRLLRSALASSAGFRPRAMRNVDAFSPQRPIRLRDWLIVTLVPALATPLVLRTVPTSFLPILLGDYLLLHFAVYGLFTALGIVWLVRRRVLVLHAPRAPALATLVGATAVLAWSTLAIGVPVDRYLFNLTPAAGRVPLIAAMLVGTLIWFAADEWLTRNARAPRWAYPFTKACFIVSLAIAVGLDLERLFFLVIIIPAILVLFIIYGLFSRWSFRATGSPWPSAFANACAFAWGIAVTFPAISR
ncbi:MAG: alpha/beta fold hydrolase [Proteobacteria bacterium]|nr:alpha/beta fold hydrolase [Burkholderiales bacterium]